MAEAPLKADDIDLVIETTRNYVEISTGSYEARAAPYYGRYNVAIHEVGHMLGNVDEYLDFTKEEMKPALDPRFERRKAKEQN